MQFENARGFDAFFKIEGGLEYDFDNTWGFDAFYPFYKLHILLKICNL